jgi:PAS domain S-box-containing protein
MPEKTRFIGQLGILFLVAAVLLALMDRQMLTGPETLSQWPFALLSLLLLAGLFVVVALLVNHRLGALVRRGDDLERQLAQVREECEHNRSELEERVDRRTFEISVANASLNREIAERIQAETEMRQLKRRLELILESAGEGIFGLDLDGQVTFVNRAAAEMLGWEPDDLVGLSHHALIHHTRADGSPYPMDECPIHQAYRDGKVHFGADEVFWHKNGQSFPVDYISTPIHENRQLRGAVVVFRDLTALTRLRTGEESS